MKIAVFHAEYGCDTAARPPDDPACCGHVVKIDDREYFKFEHPYGRSDYNFIRNILEDTLKDYGIPDDHLYDIDWENCMILED